MNRKLWVVLLAGLAIAGSASSARAQSAAGAAVRARVDSLLARMTLEEKIGQMTQVTLAVVAAQGSPQRDSVRLDPEKLREAVVKRGVGSILNVLGGALTLEGWNALVNEIQQVATRETRLGIPVLYGVDAVHGVNYTRDATLFPHNVGLAATFEPELARALGQVTATEVIESATPWNFAPVLDVGRQPLWPRFYETFGEDPLVVSRMGAEVVRGMQESGRVAATMKHYLGYSGPRTGRDRTPAALTVREVRENFLPPFRAAVQAGAKTVMVNSGEIDGVPVHASRYWLTDVLRNELGFDGVVVTDWEDVIFLHTRHRVAPSTKEAVRMAVEAGIDMSMTPNDFSFADHLAELVREGTIPESRVDESVRRILTLKAELGLLDAPLPPAPRRERLATPEAQQAARRAARESITLLKNEGGLLPLRKGTRVLVTGPAANSLTALNGGWTYTWQGTDAEILPGSATTLLEALQKRDGNVRFVQGSDFSEPGDLESVARAAAEADVVVVALGENGYAEHVGDISDLTLPDAQLRLAEAVQATGKPTVLVLVQGRPRLINRIAGAAGGIVLAYWPGMEGGEAIAEVLYGEVNPSGKLPFTYPRHPNELITYDHKFTESLNTAFDRGPGGFDPQFGFGDGLSYTSFEYRDLRLSRDSIGPGQPITVQVTVANTGSRAGKESVLLFTRQHFAVITPPVRRLRDFQKIALQPGESRRLTFTLTPEDLKYVASDGRRVFEPGAFDVMVGGLARTFRVVGPEPIGKRVP